MFENKLKKVIKNGGTAIGSFITCNSPDIIEVMALSGFDFVVIDTEHGLMSVESTLELIRAAEVRGLTPITRIAEPSETAILRSLDIGTHGIQVPQVNNKSTAEKIINAAKYFPIGNRGLALPRSANYGLIDDPLDYFEKANKETMIVVHCENKTSLDNIEEIAKIPEIDVVFLGPFDMSQSWGIPGQINHPLIEDACSRVLDACKSAGKAAGIFVLDGQQAKMRAEQGFQYITISLDVTIFAKACRNEIKYVKNLK